MMVVLTRCLGEHVWKCGSTSPAEATSPRTVLLSARPPYLLARGNLQIHTLFGKTQVKRGECLFAVAQAYSYYVSAYQCETTLNTFLTPDIKSLLINIRSCTREISLLFHLI